MGDLENTNYSQPLPNSCPNNPNQVSPDPGQHKAEPTSQNSGLPTSNEELQNLRRLILGGDPDKILNPQLNLDELAQLLPDALVHSQANKQALIRAVLPTVEAAIHTSIQEDNRILSEAFFPIIGPATRKSITAAIGNLVQSLNQTLEHSLSPQSFKWRLEARRTGKSFAEVVLVRTLVYQVEQVFLIQADSGLVMRHLMAETAIAEDPDLVAAMLTAVEDFVKESFQTPNSSQLNTLVVGDCNLWIEKGPHAILACVIRGNAPNTLRQTLRQTQEKIHKLFGSALKNFEGDATSLEAIQPYLEDCFQSQFKGKEKSENGSAVRSPVLSKRQKSVGIALISCALIGLSTWTILGKLASHRWHSYIAGLEAQPGLVVISQRTRRGRFSLTGLQDPGAVDPLALLQQTQLNPDKVDMRWEPYLSLSPELMRDRIQAALNPPDTVTIDVSPTAGIVLSGTASEQWIQKSKQQSKQLRALVANLTPWNDQQLISSEQTTLNAYKTDIEARQFRFEPGYATLPAAEQARLAEQAQTIQQLLDAASNFQQPVEVSITGYSDPSEDSSQTLWLGQLRADYLKNFLRDRGISGTRLSTHRQPRSASALADSPAQDNLSQPQSSQHQSSQPQLSQPQSSQLGGSFQVTFPPRGPSPASAD